MIVGDEEQSIAVTPQDKSARFTFELEAGETSLLTYFDDAEGERILGAYYLYVNRRG